MMPRAFIAIDVNEEVRRKLVEAQRKLAATGAQLKLVEPENIHITIKFLGDVPDGRLSEIIDAVRRAVANIPQFEMEVQGVGAFPNLRYMRVIWAGVSNGRERIIAVQKNVDRELQRLGFQPERDFVPHLTLARIKSALQKDRLIELIENMSTEEFGRTQARSIELKQSTLTSKGPIYSTLASIEFTSGTMADSELYTQK
jgi:2'-5' RNA ligase